MLSPRQVKRAILAEVQREAARDGAQVPSDILDFMEDSRVIVLDHNNQPIDWTKVIVTWES